MLMARSGDCATPFGPVTAATTAVSGQSRQELAAIGFNLELGFRCLSGWHPCCRVVFRIHRRRSGSALGNAVLNEIVALAQGEIALSKQFNFMKNARVLGMVHMYCIGFNAAYLV